MRPRSVLKVGTKSDLRFYLALMYNETTGAKQTVRVSSEGRNMSQIAGIQQEYADRYAVVMAQSANEAKEKFQRGEVLQWVS